MSSLSIVTGWDEERKVTAPFTGVAQNVGAVLTVNPVHLVFDNASDVDVVLYIDGVAWKTFVASEAILLDLRGNHGIAANFTPKLGTQFSIIGAAGTGFFSISITYAR